MIDLENTEGSGLIQSDLLIRYAIVEGINRLRANPHLLKYCFASLIKDPLTKKFYGEKTLDRAIEWFQKHHIAVIMAYKLDDPKFPCVTVSLTESAEDRNTLGDTHYIPYEDVDLIWPILVGPFTPSYNEATGILTIPETAPGLDNILSPGMLLVTSKNVTYQILEVLDDGTIRLDKNIVDDFDNSTIRPNKPSQSVSFKSATFKEVYTIGCHVQGEQEYLIFLHSIIVFILLVYRKDLLESRYLDISFIRSTDLRPNAAFDKENVYSRYITISGSVRNVWPESIDDKVTGVVLQPAISPSLGVGIAIEGSGVLWDHKINEYYNKPEVDIEPWVGDEDPLLTDFDDD